MWLQFLAIAPNESLYETWFCKDLLQVDHYCSFAKLLLSAKESLRLLVTDSIQEQFTIVAAGFDSWPMIS